MAGHSKWAQIKRGKALKDGARSKLFGKFAKLLTAESRVVSGRADAPSLRALIERAKEIDMPKENIERAIARGVSGVGGELEHITYEAFGPGGVALLIETLTDSRNRTAQEIRFIFKEHGIELGTPGSAAWAFTKTAEGYTPILPVSLDPESETHLTELLNVLDSHDDVQDVWTSAQS